MPTLSPTTLAVWRFIAAYIEREGYPPTLREMADACFISIPAALRHLDRLDWELGVIERGRGARAIKLLQRPPH